MTSNKKTKLAVLIDADNIQATVLAKILSEASKYGTTTIKRAYGDWTTQSLTSWKKVLHVHAVRPMQQFSYTTGKNSTDCALIIDAMDLLHGGKIDGFCLVSSDSDFTRLATRIREAGMAVYGFGKENTPQAFVAACDNFVFTEALSSKSKKSPPPKTPPPEATNSELQKLLQLSISTTAKEDGWAHISAVGGAAKANDPAFKPKNFGHKTLTDLLRAQPYLHVEKRKVTGKSSAQLFARIK